MHMRVLKRWLIYSYSQWFLKVVFFPSFGDNIISALIRKDLFSSWSFTKFSKETRQHENLSYFICIAHFKPRETWNASYALVLPQDGHYYSFQTAHTAPIPTTLGKVSESSLAFPRELWSEHQLASGK